MKGPMDIYAKLLGYYGKPDWWSDSPYEIMVGAVLVQNTAWGNVEKTLANFAGKLSPQYVEALPADELRALVRPSGFYHAKTACLKSITAWYGQYDYSVPAVQSQPLEKVREELLAIRGVGEETADAILLYAFLFPVFVVDTYTKRLLERLRIEMKLTNSGVKAYFAQGMEKDAVLYGNYHSLILSNSKKHCRKKPLCLGCPLTDECAGVPAQDAELSVNAGPADAERII